MRFRLSRTKRLCYIFYTRTAGRARNDMAGKLKEPMVITDYRREPVCILPIGFYFDDDRWERIWQRFDEKGASLTREDLLTLFPDEPVLET